MKIKIGINGMGRIGRMILRSIFEGNKYFPGFSIEDIAAKIPIKIPDFFKKSLLLLKSSFIINFLISR